MTEPSITRRAQPYLFVVGCPRSGTTLLQRMLDAHPQLAVANDTHFIPQVAQQLNISPTQPLTPQMVNAVVSYKRFYRLGLTEEAALSAAETAPTYAHYISNLYALFAQSKGKLLGGEKTPDYVRHIPLLHKLFPQARFIHIIRDGREVALSTLDWAHQGKGPGRLKLWEDQPLAVCALWWAWQTGQGCIDGKALGAKQYHEVRYDKLVNAPDETLRLITDFLQLPYSSKMSDFHRGKTIQNEKLSPKSAWLPTTPGLRDFKDTLSAENLSLFETLAGATLDGLGYQRTSGAPSPGTKQVAAQCQTWWDEHLAGRQQQRRKPALV